MTQEHQIHPIPPVYDEHSRILILGSFPSVKSREECFFYAHKQNRFWRVLSAILGVDTPVTIDEKKAMLLGHGIALWDVLASCDITGSSDAAIKNAVANDLTPILNSAPIEAIFTNGAKAGAMYDKLILPQMGMSAVKLPSTSPANAAWSAERLTAAWSAALASFIVNA